MPAGSRRLFRPALPILAVAAVALLAGCAFQKRDSITVGAVPDDYRTNHPIVIAEKEEILDLPVAATRPWGHGAAARFARRVSGGVRQDRGAGSDHCCAVRLRQRSRGRGRRE